MASWMISRLDQETRPHHAAADGDCDVLFRADTTPSDYLLYLVRQYGFEAPLECALAMTPGLDRLVDLKQRHRAGYLAEDLLALGVRPHGIAELPQYLDIPVFQGAPEALGWMYVVERGTLSHGVVRGHLHAKLPADAPRASAYLSSYAGQVGLRWRAFGQALDGVAQTSALADLVVDAAHAAFQAQRAWMQRDAAVMRASA